MSRVQWNLYSMYALEPLSRCPRPAYVLKDSSFSSVLNNRLHCIVFGAYIHAYIHILAWKTVYKCQYVVCAGKDAHSPRVKQFSCKLIAGVILCTILYVILYMFSAIKEDNTNSKVNTEINAKVIC